VPFIALPSLLRTEVDGVLVHPKVSDGPVFAPLVALLEKGATIVGVTGSRITMHKPRFWDELPLKARQEGRCLLFCETGMVLYRADEVTTSFLAACSYLLVVAFKFTFGF
jgi:hypothetical protein